MKRFSDRTVFVDLFGGSGLLSHITKRERPDATVIYNDHDNYRERLENISRTNALFSDLRRLSEGIPRHRMLSRDMHGIFLERIRREESTGFVDYLTISSSLLFSGKYARNIGELGKLNFYNNIRLSDYSCEGYLDGLEVVCCDYRELTDKYRDSPDVVFLIVDCAGEGMKAMMPANTILVLAWAISGVCRDLLQTPLFVKTLVADGGISGGLLPAIIFVVAGFLSFSTGTAWGTFGILIPIVVPVAQAVDPNLVLICLSATLAGSVFGDHCSPISDTTILSSAGAGCAHLEHVSTQMLYACVVAASSAVGYMVSGLMHGSLLPGFVAGLAFMVVTMLVLRQRNKQKDEVQA